MNKYRFVGKIFQLGMVICLAGVVGGLAQKKQATNQPSSLLSTTIVISQAYGGGGGSTGTYLHDYVELKNISSTSQSLNGLSLMYGSAAGQFGSSAGNIVVLPNVSLAAGQYYLVQLGNPGTAGAALPVTPDLVTTNINAAAGSGKVALTNGLAPNSCGGTATPCTLPNAQIIDLVSYGTAGNAEGGAPTNGGAAITSVQGNVRKANGCTETDNNNADFDIITAPVPRNGASTATGCSAGGGASKVDFDGDGKSDYAIVRNTPALNGFEFKMSNDISSERVPMYKKAFDWNGSEGLGEPGTSRVWWVHNSSDGSATAQPFGTGVATEIFVPEDYDGDGESDIAVWRSQSATGPGGAFFFVLNSSDSTVSQTDFGVAGDNPTVAGDYDGDGKADPAVFRCPSFPPGGQCFYFFKGSSNNPGGNVTFVPWGNNIPSDLFPNRGDFDGDGKLDFCLQRVNPSQAGQGQFVLLRSSDQGVEYINWDTSSALIVPGDYDGDGKDDIMTVRVVSTNIIWSLKTRAGVESFTQWGKTITGFNESLAPSDFDGDGKTDIAIYRRDNANPDNTFYWILRSSDGGVQTYEWGATTDTPVNGWDVN